MCISCAMMALNVTPSAKEEGAKVDEAVEVGGAAICVWVVSVSTVLCSVER